MINYYFIIFIYLVFAYGVSAITSFIPKGNRPELFELIDDVIPIFRVTLDKVEFGLLKDRADYRGLSSPRQNITDSFKLIRERAQYLLEGLMMNYHDAYPGIDFAKEIPELNIGKNGFPNIDIEDIINGMNFDKNQYVDFDFVNDNLKLQVYQSNPKFNITKITDKINEIANRLYSRSEIESYAISLSEKLNNKNLDTEILPLFKSFSKTNITLFNGVTITDKINNNNEEFEENEEYGEYEYDEADETDYDDIENDYPDSFKTKIGSLSVEIAGKKYNFDKITFSLSGQYSRYLVKPNFNLKIRGGENLLGRSQFKLRSDLTEPTLLRSKLTSDIHKRLGLPGISANYALLYINDEYMGIFVLTDHYKQSYIEQDYGEYNTTTLHKCYSGGFLTMDTFNGCDNEHDEIDPYNDPEWTDLLTALDAAESASDIENIFDVDHFLYEMAIEYLTGGWDHLQLGHNFYMYKPPKGKWLYLSYDHGHEFGINLDRVYVGFIFDDLPEYLNRRNRDYPNYSFQQYTKKLHIIDILILRDPTRFNKILKEVVNKAFNPSLLFPRIDELKKFIKPYIKLEYTPDAYGNYPGRINDLSTNPYTLAHWDANSEFTTIDTLQFNAYGIKYWILAKYRYVCRTYGISCDPVYLDKNYKYDVNKEIEFKGYYPYSQNETSTTENKTKTITTSTTTTTTTTTKTKTTKTSNKVKSTTTTTITKISKTTTTSKKSKTTSSKKVSTKKDSTTIKQNTSKPKTTK